MSDQTSSSPTPKSKPGSLRDRIAAFEKSAGSTASGPAQQQHHPPPSRPKPAAGFATWKPKQQLSPPSSPSGSSKEPASGSTTTTTTTTSGLSASDARESITKAGSLKDRMAALQNKGAFGVPSASAAPPVAPKMAVDNRPKWKPPPVVRATADEDDVAASGGGGIIAAIEKTISPPLSQEKKEEDVILDEVEKPSAVAGEGSNEGEETVLDPEGAERQRRAAIAARMARLGGARLGMAPPVVGKKPLVRRSTQEEQQQQQQAGEDAKPAEEQPSQAPSVEEQILSPTEQGYFPSRKNSGNTVSLESPESHAAKTPTSMPIPANPRRVGPPRKKASKSNAPPPELPEEKSADVVDEQLEKVEESAVRSTIGVGDSVAVDSTKEEAGEDRRETEDRPVEVVDVSNASDLRGEEAEADVLPEPASSPPLDSTASPVISGTRPPPPSHVTEDVSEVEGGEEELEAPYPTAPSRMSLSAAIPPLQAIAAAERAEISDDEDQEATSTPQLDYVPEEPSSQPLKATHGNLDEAESDSDVSDYSQTALSDQHEKLESPPSTFPLSNRDCIYSVSSVPDVAGQQNVPSYEGRPVPGENTIGRPAYSSVGSESDETSSPSRRLVSPPRRIVPQVPEEENVEEDEGEEESDQEAYEIQGQSHLFIPPPKEKSHTKYGNVQDEDDGAGDGSENDAPALPVPNRWSAEESPFKSDPQSDDSFELDSDHDGQPLPVPPRPVPPPRNVPPPPPQGPSQYEDKPDPDHETSSVPRDTDMVDDEDPINPDLISPSRRASYTYAESQIERSPPAFRPLASRSLSLRASQSPHHSLPTPVVPEEDDTEQIKRKTIAERMARLGGIKFGAAPIPGSVHRSLTKGPDAEQSDEIGNTPEVADETEEESARKERIAARLAQMGGMRIGMMPTGMGGVSASRSHRQEEQPSSPTEYVHPPTRPVPPSNQATNVDSDPASASTSDDGVKVEAEESEAEEVNYQDVEPEELPPSLPSRDNRPPRRQGSTDTVASSSSRTYRPPVPAAPPRRSSLQTHVIESLQGAHKRKNSSSVPQSDFVMVEQESQEATATSRAPPARRAPEVPETEESQEILSSQWELPSVPTGTLDLADSDLLSSWTDAGESRLSATSGSLPQPAQASTPQPKSLKSPTTVRVMSADDLIAVWGRVGVQVCEVATALFEKSKRLLIGDGTYEGFVKAVLADVPNVTDVSVDTGEYGYLIYSQNGSVVQKRASDIMPGDIIEFLDARFKGHKGLHAYQQTVGGSGELVIGIVGEFETRKSKIKVFQANQHVGQQTVETVSYRLEDLKSGTIKIYRVLGV